MARSAWHEVQVARFMRLLEDIPGPDLKKAIPYWNGLS